MPKESARHVAIEAKHLRPGFDHVSLRSDALAAFAAAFVRRLAVVCAPAGYGKTTMTAAALDHCDKTAAWYKLDILDHDPIAFLASVIRALRRVEPEFGTALLRELEANPVVDVPVEILAAQFCSECDQRLTGDLHLVLDDYHEAMESAAMNSVLGYLLENCPQTLHFVVLTRYEPVFRLEKLNLSGEVARLQRDQLVFDAGQVAEVLALKSGRSYDASHVQRVLELTEGWPASVVLAGMTLTWLDVASLQDALSDPRLRGDVFSYLAEQVFQRQTDEVQLFLLGTCCLEHVTVELAEAVTGSGRASRHLTFLARNHVFTFDTERRGAFRYHNLLRDFLVQRFVQDEGETAFRALQRRTAVALEDCGDRPGAIELLLNANELTLALGVIARGGEAELERCPSEQLRLWVGRLSPRAESGEPWAQIASAVLDTRDSHFFEALQQLRRASVTLERIGDERALYQALSITEWAEFWSGDSAASMRTCKRALSYAERDDQRLHSLLSLMSAAVDMKQWDIVSDASTRAESYMSRAVPEEASRAEALKAHAAYYQGNMIEAHALVARSHQHGSAAQRAATLNIQGMIETALGDYEAARSHLEDAAGIADDFGHASTSYMIEDSRACLACAMGQSLASISALETLSSEEAHTQESSLQSYTLCHLGTALRRADMLEASMVHTERAIELAPMSRDPYLALNAAANLSFSEGLTEGGPRETLREISRLAASRGLRFVEFKANLFLAILLYDSGSTTPAVELLEACLPRQFTLGHVNLVAQELCPRPEIVSALLKRHRQNEIGPLLVDTISHHWLFSETADILRERGPSQVSTWVDRVHKARVREWSSARPQTRLDGCGSLSLLTRRELQVLELMASDHTNEEIASTLFISIPTVKTHVNHILRKLEQKTRVGAILVYQHMSKPRGFMSPGSRRNVHPGP